MVRVSCARSPRWAADTGDGRPIRLAGHAVPDPGHDIDPGTASGPLGTVASSSARHGRLRRNAVSPHGVRLSGAPGAPPWNGCSSANRALAGNLLWDGIVAVPEVFVAGCPVLFSEERGQPGGSARTGEAGEQGYSRPDAPRAISLACGHIKRRTEERKALRIIVDIRRLSEQREPTLAPAGAAVPGRRA